MCSKQKGAFGGGGVPAIATKHNNAEEELALKLRAADCWYWVYHEKLLLGGQPYRLEGHEYQVDWLQCDHPNQCFKKGAQMGATETQILKTLHGHKYGRYPQGTLYLFPTQNDVTDFSKGRFKPLIDDNPTIAACVRDTDAANIKQVGGGTLYFRGARASQKIEGMKLTSSALKSVPVDRIVFDEKDEMNPYMVFMALERISHSTIQEQVAVSTPTIPDYGIDKDYTASDQRVWMLKCKKCGADTCLEIQFLEDPYSCLEETRDGSVIRVCQKCRNEIHPRDGRWVAQYPSVKDKVGWWISQLNSMYVAPGKILQLFLDPPDGNITEVYNSKLGVAHIAADNRLTRQDVYDCCSSDAIARESYKTCAMGVDVGKELHVVIGYPEGEKEKKKKKRVLYVGRVEDFGQLHDLAEKFNVKSAVLDIEPETRKVREFQDAESYRIYLCDYQENLRQGRVIHEDRRMVVIRRTEICDTTHEMVVRNELILPRRGGEVDKYVQEMTNIAKVLIEDELSGSKKYLYKKLGADHYRHATNYFYLACEAPGLGRSVRPIDQLLEMRKKTDEQIEVNPFDSLR